MSFLPLLILLAAVVYFSKPEERKRFAREALSRTEHLWGSAGAVLAETPAV